MTALAWLALNVDAVARVLILATLLATFGYLCYQRGRITGFARGCRNEREFMARRRIQRSRVKAGPWWQSAN